ncbi:hypothetical protein BST22_27660 [Mycolicibacterium chubuense]|uniref:Metallopeptidase DUF4344 n=1 Tax=Mycolicibacterium chubuense TaxID=1800 RepID=A0A0J6WFX0_MYCCU|nr:DUF4344 domain-containing metallopeptidase [Mycolicibacterium chubuense]KMO82145.1 hypothetical protein MCHUDSM44219_01654 [Mycolicibacterium chubuense]ORA42946.1 hypothetical protein BST22_27660 [Mycolicibacterium chubuense]SPX99937.1 Uncharacterised protein [Mycolicibacterium chubuense]
MRVLVAALSVIGLLTAGCGNAPSPGESSSPAPSAAPAPTVDNAGDGGPEGSMTVSYEDATTPDAMAGRDLLQNNQVLEDMADDVNQTLALPYDVSLLGVQCDEANAFWDPTAKTVTICYEDAANSERIFTEAGDPDPAASAINAEWATFFHEVGHMAVTLYDLPVTGREEDVADQLAAYILLTPGDDGKADPESVQSVKDFARVFNASGNADVTDDDMADVHSLDKQRVYNLECWIYGSDPEANGDMVGDGQLPEDRADGCADEWAQLDKAWSTLLDPYFRS